jgi:O-antigen/teichoic acid export membrane protein
MNVKTKLLYFFKGSLISKAIGLLTFFFLAKVVSLETFGIYTIYLFINEMLLISLTYGFNSYILRNSSKEVRLKLFPKALFIIIVTFIIFTVSILLSKSLFLEYLPSSYLVIFNSFMVVITITFLQSIIKMISGYFISNHMAKDHMKITILHSVAKLCMVLLLFYVLNISELNLILYSLLISSVIAFIFGLFLIKSFINIKYISFKESMVLIYDASPFMLKIIIGTFGLYLSRLILDSMATKEELAVYSFYLMIIFQLSFFTNIISQSIIPSIRDNFNKLDVLQNNLDKYLKKYYILASIVLLLTVIISYFISNKNLEILELFVKEEYLEHIWLFTILMISFFIGSLTVVFDVWQYHELMNVKLKLFTISISSVIAGVIVYPIGYTIGNIYGVAIGYVIITSSFTYVSLYFFRNLIRMIESEKHIHNS